MGKRFELTFFIELTKYENCNFLDGNYNFDISNLRLEMLEDMFSYEFMNFENGITVDTISKLSTFVVNWITEDNHLKFIAEQANKNLFGEITRKEYKKYFIKKLFEEMKKSDFIRELKSIVSQENLKRLVLLSEFEREVINNG